MYFTIRGEFYVVFQGLRRLPYFEFRDDPINSSLVLVRDGAITTIVQLAGGGYSILWDSPPEKDGDWYSSPQFLAYENNKNALLKGFKTTNLAYFSTR